MNSKLNWLLFLMAGTISGLVPRYFSTPPIHAQSAPTVVQAQSFVLVNESGQRIGEFAVDQDGRPNLKLFENKPGSSTSSAPIVIWSARSIPSTAARPN